MKKNILLFVLLLLSAITAGAQTQIDDIWYNLDIDTKQGTVTWGDAFYTGTVNIPETVTYEGITYKVTSIRWNAFENCSDLISVSIPNSVTKIGMQTFMNCSGLTSVIIPNSVTQIGYGAFTGCSSLTSITIPNSVTLIGGNAFAGCSALTSVIIPNNVTSIGSCAFLGCKSLTSAKIGNSVTTIGEDAFGACPSLKDVYCYAEKVPNTDSKAFQYSNTEYATLYVPKGSMNSYQETAPWSRFRNFIGVTPKCATPTIVINNGKVEYHCETKNAELHYEYLFPQAFKGIGDESIMPQKMTISVYATKEFYEDSDVATKEIDLRADINLDGEVGMPDVMFIVNHILNGKFPDEE